MVPREGRTARRPLPRPGQELGRVREDGCFGGCGGTEDSKSPVPSVSEGSRDPELQSSGHTLPRGHGWLPCPFTTRSSSTEKFLVESQDYPDCAGEPFRTLSYTEKCRLHSEGVLCFPTTKALALLGIYIVSDCELGASGEQKRPNPLSLPSLISPHQNRHRVSCWPAQELNTSHTCAHAHTHNVHA